MSGIAGIIRFDGAPVDAGLVETMTAAMSHRGPDGTHQWADGTAALGQCMLRTTPESLEEAQPLANEDESLVLVMDGRVDNWEELRRDLLAQGRVLRDRSDAELVLRGYETWGPDCPKRIEGDFAFVIWDSRHRLAFCARDRMGSRPLNYHWDGTTLAFSSELHAILSLPWVKRELDQGTLAEYLGSAWHSRSATFWKGITRLVPAHRMNVGAAGPHSDRYWEPDLSAKPPFARKVDHVEHYRWLLGDVVRRLSRSHRPAAFEVSGGLDSSAVFAMAHHLRRQGRLLTPSIEGYTLDFLGEGDADEMEYARAVGEHLGVGIREVPPALMPIDWFRDWASRYREFPGYPNGTMSLGLREAARTEGARVLLTGGAGDEWLGLGPPGHYYAEEIAQGHWRQVRDCLAADNRALGTGKTTRWFVRSGLVPLLPTGVKRTLLSLPRGGRTRESWLAPELQVELDRRRAFHDPAAGPRVERRSQRRQLAVLGDAYVAIAREMEERSAARQGLELRTPFLSRPIVELAFATPEWLRSIGCSTKHYHREAMRGLLPERVRTRQTKADFMGVFRAQLDAIGAEALSRIPERRSGWVRPDRVARLCGRRHDRNMAGWVEWWLWTLVGCDALV